ncbi:MAG: hypothetical protein LUP97_01605 [Methanoregula sp.]|nr:hypothetical protein [Methanoregula sp.]
MQVHCATPCPPVTPAAAEVTVVLPTPAPGAAMSPAGSAGLPEYAGIAGTIAAIIGWFLVRRWWRHPQNRACSSEYD